MICNCRHLLFSRSNPKRLAEHVARTTKNKNAYTSLAGKFKEREHLENVGVNGIIQYSRNLKEIGLEIVGWIHVSQDNDT